MSSVASPDVQVSRFQQKVLAIPAEFDICLTGGRGGGKSTALALLVYRFCAQFGAKARVLVVRKHHRGLEDFAALFLDLVTRIYGRAVRFNSAAGTFKLPGGGYVELNQLDGPASWSKMQGRSFGLVCTEEAGEFAVPAELDKLRSCLRASAGVPVRFGLTANPGGPGHGWIRRRYMHKSQPWQAFTCADSGRATVLCPSTLADNTFIDQGAYAIQLKAACGSDGELLKAWLTGSWDIARGAYFGDVLDERRSSVPPWPTPDEPPEDDGGDDFTPDYWGVKVPPPSKSRYDRGHGEWDDYVLGHDFGVSAPSYTVLGVVSPGGTGPDGRFYPKDSIILIRELSSADPADPARGLGWTVPILSEAIKEMVKPFMGSYIRGWADDSIFNATGSDRGSIADQFRHYGICWMRAGKGSRISGWAKLRALMEAAREAPVPADGPGLYCCSDLNTFWETVPVLARDARRIEDVDSRQNDHPADAVRYLILGHERGGMGGGTTVM